MFGGIAGPRYLNSPELAKALIESKELPERDSLFECFKKMGKKEYFVSRCMMEKITGSKDIAHNLK